MTETYYPVLGRITLYSNNHHREPVRITATALTDLEGSVRISNWKINDTRTEVTLTIVDNVPDFHNAYRESSHDEIYPCEIKETPLPKPGRSFRWSEFGGCWVHSKTGVRVVNA